MSAKVSRLNELHELLAELFIDDIKVAREEGIPLAASDKAVIAKFLKDNNISAEPDTEDMQALNDEFRKEIETKRRSRAEAIIARSEAEDEVFTHLLC